MGPSASGPRGPPRLVLRLVLEPWSLVPQRLEVPVRVGQDSAVQPVGRGLLVLDLVDGAVVERFDSLDFVRVYPLRVSAPLRENAPLSGLESKRPGMTGGIAAAMLVLLMPLKFIKLLTERVPDWRQYYGGRSLHEQSHGESFIALARNKRLQGSSR